MAMKSGERTNWIWLPGWTVEDRAEARIVLFRKELVLDCEIKSAVIRITADSRYKLYVNQKLLEIGPMKGDNQVRYVDTVDLKKHLKKDVNILSAEVLAYPTDHDKGNHGTFRTETPGLFVKGYIEDISGWRYDISADETWKCKKLEDFSMIREAPDFSPLMFYEKVKGRKDVFGWKQDYYDASTWESAKMYESYALTMVLREENLKNRTIPFMKREKRLFRGVIQSKESVLGSTVWNDLLYKEKELEVPANTEEVIEIDAGEETTGFLKLALSDGGNASIEILYSECYVQKQMVGAQNLPLKTDRLDYENGMLVGYSDCYNVCGHGTAEHPEIYTPFWFRTFRLIRLRIRTGERPICIRQLSYEEVSYPLEVKTRVQTSDPTHDKIWEISERTLRRCMHETYEDTPYYEQLQYAQDARSQILYTYAISGDDRLARQCMDDFRRSQRYDGLINCSYPNYEVNVIPGFSIYYILMVYDHMMYFGDKKLIRNHMAAIDRILNYFESNLTEQGYVGKLGGVNHEQTNWSFVDWTPEWDETEGVPFVTRKGPITMESLQYILGLQKAARLADYIGWPDLAKDFHARAQKVQQAVLENCIGENGMIQDGPGIDVYSQHCQVFGILTNTLQGEKAKEILEETVVHRGKYAQCTVAMSFYLFRALEKTGLYEYTDHYWNVWRKMVENHCTTCTESEAYGRSECHAWGSLILYELPTITLGVRPAAPGYEKIAVKPVPGYLTWANGTVHTPKGDLIVCWEKAENGNLHLEVQGEAKKYVSIY